MISTVNEPTRHFNQCFISSCLILCWLNFFMFILALWFWRMGTKCFTLLLGYINHYHLSPEEPSDRDRWPKVWFWGFGLAYFDIWVCSGSLTYLFLITKPFWSKVASTSAETFKPTNQIRRVTFTSSHNFFCQSLLPGETLMSVAVSFLAMIPLLRFRFIQQKCFLS